MQSSPLYDVIVVDGSITGCIAAIEAADLGARVLLIESRSYLGREFTSTLRPWIGSEGISKTDKGLLDLLSIDLEVSHTEEEELPLKMGAIKKNLLNRLRRAQVKVLFMTNAAGVLTSGGIPCGMLIANKSGLQAITSSSIIDATENHIVAQLSGWRGPCDVDYKQKWQRTIEWVGVTGDHPDTIVLPDDLGIDSLVIHRGDKERGHVYTEFSFELSSLSMDYSKTMDAELLARTLTIQLCEFLRNHVTSFQEAVLIRASEELWSSCPGHRVHTSYLNLLVLQTEVMLRSQWSLLAVEEARRITKQQVGDFMQKLHEDQGQEPSNNVMHICMKDKEQPIETLDDVRKDTSTGILYYPVRLEWNEMLPKLDPVQVVVAGGGTAGAPAAIGAAKSGARVLLIEGQSGLGGTGTIGGINVYWFGYKEGYTAELDAKVDAMTRRISQPTPGKLWNIEAKMMVYLEELVNQGGNVLFRARVMDVLKKGGRITDVIFVTPGGLCRVPTECIVDATGDADVAALAGVPYELGESHGGNIQTYNICEWKISSLLAGVNIDLGVMDATNVFDTTRSIILGHDKTNNNDFSSYPAVRESRHIRGSYVWTVEDALSGRRFHDTIAVGFTDYDQHALQSSDYARMGYLPYHHDCKKVRFPYRACLPEEIDNLIVTGKGFSSERDAFSFMRMQPDLQNMGYAVGLASAQMIQEKVPFREINIQKLQHKLLHIGNITEDDIQIQDEANLDSLMDAAGDAEGFLRLISMSKKSIVEALKQRCASKEACDARLEVAMALAWFGETDGMDLIFEALTSLQKTEQVSAMNKAGIPIGGFIGQPDNYWKVNQLITVLGRSGDPKALNWLYQTAMITDAGGAPRPHARLHWRRVPNYDRIVCLCRSLERFASSQAIHALVYLLSKPYLRGHVMEQGDDADGSYASALLEVIIARTLAKSGGYEGIRILIDYLADVRAVLTQHAHASLIEVTKMDLGPYRQPWDEWFEQQDLEQSIKKGDHYQ